MYTIGVGTAAGSQIQMVNEQGKQDLLRDREGNVVQSHLDDVTLTAIAEATHGTYQPLGAVGEGFNRVRHLVETSTNAADFSKARKLGVDRYYFPVAGVIVLIVVESLIGTRRKVRESGKV